MVDKATLEGLLCFSDHSVPGDPEDSNLLSRNVQSSPVTESGTVVLILARSPRFPKNRTYSEDVVGAVPVAGVVLFDDLVDVLDGDFFVLRFSGFHVVLDHVSIVGPGSGQGNSKLDQASLSAW